MAGCELAWPSLTRKVKASCPTRAAVAGSVMYLMMWSVVLPLTTNPIVDDHLTGAVTLILFAVTGAGATWGLGRRWAELPAVASNPWLR